MKNKVLKTLAIFIVTVIIIAEISISNFSVNAMSYSDYKTRYTSFINDARWKEGANYGENQSPKSGTTWNTGSKSCCAYVVDFIYYVYGMTSWGSKYTDVSQIKTGDTIWTGSHWFVVLERNGGSFYTAEGNVNGTVAFVRNDRYRIYNGKLQTNYSSGYNNSNWQDNSFSWGYHYDVSASANDNSSVVVTWSDYNDKYSVGSTNAVLTARIDFTGAYTSDVSVSGINLYDANGNLIKTHSESLNISNNKQYLYSWYDCNDELGVTLTPNTTYKYQIFYVIKGTKYESPIKTFTTNSTGGNTSSSVNTLAKDKIQIYSQWNYDAYGSYLNGWICGSGCGLLTIGHALQWLGIIEKDQETENATICNIFVESGYEGTVLWSERDNTLKFIASKYPDFKYEYNTDLRSIINNGGVALVSKYGHQYLAVDISPDSNYVHIVDSCLTVPSQNNVAVYSYNSNTGNFTQTSVADCAVRNDIKWYCMNTSTNEMGKAKNGNPLYAGGDYWVKYSEVSGAAKVGFYSTHVHNYTEFVYFWKSHPHYNCYKCSCGDIKENRDEMAFEWSAWTQTKAPTCTEKGIESRACSYCGKTETRDLAALGHKPSDWIIDREAQVGVAGSKHKECTVCKTVIETAEIPALDTPPITYAYFNVNGKIDGVEADPLGNYVKFDLYFNGELVGAGLGDYYKKVPVGTEYEVKNVQPENGYSFTGMQYGSLKATVGENGTAICFKLVTNTYTITYNANGGTGAPANQTKTYGVDLTLSGTKPTKTYTITYNANGGSVSPSSKTVSAAFVNWKAANGTTYAPGGTYTANEGTTLTAQWTNPTAGTLAIPTRTGYTFDGWFTAASGGTQVASGTTITGNTIVYAKWTKDIPQTDANVVVTGGKALKGKDVAVTVALENNPGVSSIRALIDYNSDVMTVKSVEFSSQLSGGDYMTGTTALSAKPLIVNIINNTDEIKDDIVLVTITFTVNENAEAGTYPITLTLDQDNVFDINQDDVLFNVKNGSVEVITVMLGDVNGDGKVNNKDVVTLFRLITAGTTEFRPERDINGDGKINNKDVVQLFRKTTTGT